MRIIAAPGRIMDWTARPPFSPISLRQSQNRTGLFPFQLQAAYITVTCGGSIIVLASVQPQ
jgi:hypothetical protein